MTVKELRELTLEAPDDMEVMILGGESALNRGFMFLGACICDSGVIELGPPNDIDTGAFKPEKVFAVLPHGFGATQEEIEKMGDNPIPEIEN